MAFLDLPQDVRRRIYEHALVRSCPIDLTYWEARSYQATEYRRIQDNYGIYVCWKRDNHMKPHNRSCVCAPLPVALLRVCRTVHAEAAAVLYGKNKFVIRGRTFANSLDDEEDDADKKVDHRRYDDHYDKYRLKRIPPAIQFAPILAGIPLYGLASMTSLLVRLNCWPCPLGHEEVGMADRFRNNPFEELGDAIAMGYCRVCSMRSDRADYPLSLPPDTSTDEDEEYQRPATKNEAMLLSTLDLTVICDVNSEKAAKRVVAPLMQHILPAARLKACTIRLGRCRRGYALTAIARRTAAALVAGLVDPSLETSYMPSSTEIFPFRRLPAELRVKILQETALGTTKVVRIVNGRQFFPGRIYMDVACCNKCTPTYRDCCYPHYYAGVSAHCQCTILPTELFSVDRQMYREAALDQFYSRVALHLESDRFETTLAFLEQMTPATLRSLARINIKVTKAQYELWRAAVTGGRDEEVWAPDQTFVYEYESRRGDPGWADLVAFIRDNMDPSRLGITLDLEECVWDYYESYLISDEPTGELMMIFRDAYAMYMDLTTELCTIKTLAKLQIQLSVFENLAPWLVREVLGPKRDPYKGGTSNADIEKQYPVSIFRRPHVRIPYYHDIDQHLQGSNYNSEV
ncbi:hypothetical protein SEUCBS140593_001307 [Sporothrix eucalyptigena]|uniref:F-box domain-containing protein n=1 Tax=Sporothrix eucalyptigena TaxID=1812306 RepID=A0ABP0AX43_9PEZI